MKRIDLLTKTKAEQGRAEKYWFENEYIFSGKEELNDNLKKLLFIANTKGLKNIGGKRWGKSQIDNPLLYFFGELNCRRQLKC